MRGDAPGRSTALALLVGGVGVVLALRSLALGVTLSSPVPSFDGWAVVDDLQAWHDGRFGFADLFAQHNEHRIVTTRMTFLADYALFHLDVRAVVAADYALFGVLAAVLAALATRGRPWRVKAVAGALALAGLWSVAGWINLVWSFQIQWAYAHLLPVLAICSFAAAVARTGRRRWALLAAACLFDALAVFSMSSGLLTIVPVAAVAVWRRAPLRPLAAFAAAHAALAALYLLGFDSPAQPLAVSPLAVLRYIAPVLGTPFPASKTVAIDAGAVGSTLACAALAWATWSSLIRGRAVDGPGAVLLGAVLFALAEAAAMAVGRAGMPNPTQLALRYATPGELLWTGLGLFAWRSLDRAGRRGAARIVAGLALGAVVASNFVGDGAAAMKTWSTQSDAEGFNLIDGVKTDERGQGIVDLPDWEQRQVDFLRGHQLGPFAESEGRFRAPLNSLSGLTPAALPICDGRLDDVSVRGGAVAHVQGWARAPGGTASAAWALVFASDGRLLGYGRAWQRRLDPGLPVGHAAVLGFSIWLRLPAVPTEMGDLAAVFPDRGGPPCRMPIPAPRRLTAEGDPAR